MTLSDIKLRTYIDTETQAEKKKKHPTHTSSHLSKTLLQLGLSLIDFSKTIGSLKPKPE